MALTKAKIIASLNSGDKTIPVLFNPNEYEISAGNNFKWQEIPGLSQPIAQFSNGSETTLKVNLFFDTYEQGTDVRTYTKQITSLLDVDKDLHAPPLCRFVWGSLDFKGVITSISQRFTMFLDTGEPVRATLNVSFRLAQSVTEQYQNIPRQSADRTKQRTVKQGDQLWHIAHEEYENSGMWRSIANANNIDNPRNLQTGRRLIVPRLE
ncbi:MAG: CIS tube protein [Tumebacillaceae bacterium]